MTFLLAIVSWSFAITPTQVAVETPQQVAQSLLEADRSFSAAGARSDLVSALTPMLAEGVIMPSPQGGFVMGKPAVLAALRNSPDATTARATWTPIRVGISADGAHGFTFGYMTLRRPDSTTVPLKYMAYWVRESAGWRVLAYKRGRSAGAASDAALMPPSLPQSIIAARRDAATIATLRRDLMNSENAFSAEAQKIGLGNAFAKFGLTDAVNMGGPASAIFVVGATTIAQSIGGGDMTASPVHWGADTAFVASSGDLGITFGVIRANKPPPGTDPLAGPSFFTIWRRSSPQGPWRYLAE